MRILHGYQKKRQIYDGINNLIRYYDYKSKARSHYAKKKIPLFLDTTYLTLVSEGKMFIVDIDKDDKVNVREIEHVAIRVVREFNYKYYYYTIDVVARKYFGKYLKSLKNDHAIITRSIKKVMKSA